VIGPSLRSIFSSDWEYFPPVGPKGGLEGGLEESLIACTRKWWGIPGRDFIHAM
jgi:hypothetical protein